MKSSKIAFFSTIVFLVCVSFFVLGENVFGGYQSSTDNPNSLLNNPFNNTTLQDFLEVVVEHLLGIIAFLAVMFIVIGGVLYMASGGNQKIATAARICIVSAIIGFAVAAAGPAFLNQLLIVVYNDGINPAIPTDLDDAPIVQEIVSRVVGFLLSIVGMLGIIGLTVSGVMYLFALGDSTQAQNAKKALVCSIIGIAFAGAALIIVRQISIFFA